MKSRIGVFSVGLEAYWPQFPGLKERLQKYHREIEARISGFESEVVPAGLVDTVERAREAGQIFAKQDVDLIVCHTATYATSSQVLPVAQAVRLPVLVLNLQPAAALDYERTDTQEWLANCSACCVPEIATAFTRAGVDFHVVSGVLREDGAAWKEIEDWCRAAGVARAVRRSRVGFLGHTYPGMLDMYADFALLQTRLGVHIEVLEMCDLAKRVEGATERQIQEKLRTAKDAFEIENAPEADLLWAAQVAAGLDRLVEDFRLDGLAYYYRGLDGNEYERLGAAMILGNSLLTARGVSASGEGDIKNCLAMIMLDRLGCGGSFTEFYAMDFRENFVLMGHDGPGHIAISEGRPKLRGLGLYHGKRGAGVSVEFKVKTGPVTILSLTQTGDGDLKLVGAEGVSLPGPTMRIGNTNSRLRFGLPPGEFVNRWSMEGPSHHCALGIGHNLGRIAKLASLLKLPLSVV